MDSRGRADRSTAQGFRIGENAADLITDIQRQDRRRLLRRAAKLTALGVALLLVGLAFKFAADRRAQSRTLDQAREHFVRGTVVELRAAVSTLEGSLEEHAGHEPTLAALALARSQLWMEFGEEEQDARAAALAVENSDLADAVLARAMVSVADGDVEGAASSIEGFEPADDGLSPQHGVWVLANIALAGDGSQISEAVARMEAVPEDEAVTAHDRVHAALILAAGDRTKALAVLERAREQNRTHMGLAADEALYNAYLRQELSGVADVADQLLRSDGEFLSARDRAHARLARGVVHVQTGEASEGLERIEEAWPVLPPWDRAARELALQAALEAGDAERVRGWLTSAKLPEPDMGIYEAWAALASGDILKSLALLAELPQDHPRVAYLQALALVEQRRFEEAQAWLERADKLLPGRIEIEVAQARVELHVGDPAAALNKLKALAEEEPYAPRAWTGLGEAQLAQEEPALRAAQKALERALEREPAPAEAMLQLAEVWVARRGADPEASSRALTYLEQAARTNSHVARYDQALALHVADLGDLDRAVSLLKKLSDRQGIDAQALVTLAELSIERAPQVDDKLRGLVDEWMANAEKVGARPDEILRVRSALALADEDPEGWERARQELDVYLNAVPDDVAARLLYVRLHMKLGGRDTAEASIRRGLQVSAPSEHGLLFLEWARLEARSGSRKKAAAHARVAWTRLQAGTRPPRVLLDAARFACAQWQRQNNSTAAMAIARKLTERLPQHSDAWTIRAGAQLAANQTPEARASAERALELNEDNPRAHELHGHALLRTGYRDKARAEYERALELVKGTPDEISYRENLRRL